jgi:hypothetical protein
LRSGSRSVSKSRSIGVCSSETLHAIVMPCPVWAPGGP